MQIIDGRKIGKEILESVKAQVAGLPFVPVFCDVLVGNDPASVQYVNIKARTAESLGFKFHRAQFPETITTDELVAEIQKLNKVENMCGIIVQLPLPAHLDRQKVLDAILPELDVDCLGSVASGKFYDNENQIGYPTALACAHALDSLGLELQNKKILILGQGVLVGSPVSALLKFRGLSLDVVTRATENKNELLKSADVIISGLGQGKYINGDMIKDGAVIIDAGTSEENGSIVGDVDMESIKDKASFITPTPGGVGPITVAMLFKNVLQVAQGRIQ